MFGSVQGGEEKGCQDGVQLKGMIDLVLVKKDMLHYVQDVMSVRGME